MSKKAELVIIEPLMLQCFNFIKKSGHVPTNINNETLEDFEISAEVNSFGLLDKKNISKTIGRVHPREEKWIIEIHGNKNNTEVVTFASEVMDRFKVEVELFQTKN